MEKEKYNDYIGDGVYVSYDGYNIGISVNDHRNPPVVYLDADVLNGLIRYAKRIGVLKNE